MLKSMWNAMLNHFLVVILCYRYIVLHVEIIKFKASPFVMNFSINPNTNIRCQSKIINDAFIIDTKWLFDLLMVLLVTN